jgi:PAS domain S-box-containing protein
MARVEPILATGGLFIEACRASRARRRAEAALRESEVRFRMIADAAPVMIWMSGPDERCTYVSKSVLAFTGRSLEQVVGDGWVECIHPDDVQSCLNVYHQAFDNRASFLIEVRLQRGDGGYGWILSEGSPCYFPDGAFAGYIGSATDITERKEVEGALRRSEERYRRVVEAQSDLICRFLPDTTLTFVNEPYARYFRRSANELVGIRFLSLIPDHAHADVLRQLASFGPEQTARTYEHEVLLPDGSRSWQEWTDQAIFNEHGALVEFQSVGRDITDRKRAEEVLRRSETALQESQNELRSLARKLLSAHEEERSWLARELHDDLSQRLAALAIETAMLEVDCRSLPESALKRLRDLKDRLADISTDVHNISRQLHPAILKDLGLADAVQSECLRFADREGVQVEFLSEAIPVLPSEVAICLYRIVQEGLHNIAKHAKTDKARVTLRSDEHRVVLSIQDFGVGFDPASERSVKGLGLASMRERAWLALGDIEIRSRPGQGTMIDVNVPLGEHHP